MIGAPADSRTLPRSFGSHEWQLHKAIVSTRAAFTHLIDAPVAETLLPLCEAGPQTQYLKPGATVRGYGHQPAHLPQRHYFHQTSESPTGVVFGGTS